MSSYLVLGAVLFQDFELPERISWGGAHVIDALGRDDKQITWSGVFSGSGASDRARLLDLMRADGSVWPLTWDAFFYSVVIASFDADYSRSSWIPYRIACTVLRDEAEALVMAAASLAADALADLTSADGFGSGIDLNTPLAALAAPGATTLGSGAYAAALAAVSGASTSIDGAMATQETALNGTTIDTSAGLTQATGSAGALAALAGARGYVQRTAVNLQNAST